MGAKERKVWSEKIIEQMNSKLKLTDYERVFFHAGKNYREFLIPEPLQSGLMIEVPLEKLRLENN